MVVGGCVGTAPCTNLGLNVLFGALMIYKWLA